MKKESINSIIPVIAAILCSVAVVAAGLSSAPQRNWELWGAHEKQYEALTEAISSGSLSLLEEPAEFLKELENPYDPIARSVAAAESGSYALIDVAYYDGRYFVYFGLAPALLIFLPIKLLTGRTVPTWLADIAMALLCVPAAFVFVRCLLRRFFRERVSPAAQALLGVTLISCLGIPYLAAFCTTYSLPSVTGTFFALSGLSLFLSAEKADGGLKLPHLILGSAALGLTAGCRPSLVLSFLLLFPIFKDAIKKRSFFGTDKTSLVNTGCVLLPAAAVTSIFLIYNTARFGSPFDFGYRYLLTTRDLLHGGKGAGEVLESLRLLFLAPPRLKSTFPFMETIDYNGRYVSTLYVEPLFGGLLPLHPALTAGLVIFVLLAAARRGRFNNNGYLLSTSLVSLAVGAVILLTDSVIAGVSQRYASDIALFFFIPAALAWGRVAAREKKDRLSAAACVALAVLIVLTCSEVFLQLASILCDGRYFAMRDWNTGVYELMERFYINIAKP